MFQGTIPTSLRAIIYEAVSQWDCPAIYVGCSGNFTIERVLDPLKRFSLHSNDVTIYSTALGRYFAGEDVPLQFTEKWREHFEWAQPYLSEREDRVATLLLFTLVLKGLGKDDNPYWSRINREYRDKFSELHAATKKRFSQMEMSVQSFFCGDVMDYVDAMPDDAGFCSFPPFFKGGYEKMFSLLADVFEWTPPDYTVLGEEHFPTLYEKVRTKKYWLIGHNQIQPELEEFRIGYVRPTNRAMPMWVYSNSSPTRIAVPAQKIAKPPLPCLLRGETLGERLYLANLTPDQFSWLRSEFLDPNIAPASCSPCFAVCVDDRIIGAFSPSRADYDPYAVYIMSDFAVSPTDYPRLSKLVVMALLSKEAQRLSERSTLRRVRTVCTTAFAKNPVSMKYRSLLKLVKRSDSPYRQGEYMLQYEGEAGRWTLPEAFAEWKRKYANES